MLVLITAMKMMTMDTRTNTNKTKRLIKMLERLIALEHLYTDEQLKDMKKQLRVVKEEMNNLNTKLKRGFGS